MTKKGDKTAQISFDEIYAAMDEAVETVSYSGEIRDWRTMPELGEEIDEEILRVPDMQIIVQIGAEGGDITLYGVNKTSGWVFSRRVIDQTLLMADEEGQIDHSSEVVRSWSDALALLSRYPWHRLYPLQVHPEFKERVLAAVRDRFAADHPSSTVKRASH